jgi:hypothetical protein
LKALKLASLRLGPLTKNANGTSFNDFVRICQNIIYKKTIKYNLILKFTPLSKELNSLASEVTIESTTGVSYPASRD